MITLRISAHQKMHASKKSCSMKHHNTLHDYFTQKEQVENEGMKPGK